MKRVGTFITGLLVGATLFGGTAAYAAGIMAEQSTNRFLVDGQEVQLDAYAINGSNYLKLRDIGAAVGFNVYWDTEQHCVQIESDTPYTGVAPAVNREAMPSASYNQSEVKPAPQVGDIVLCSDGYTYEIKDANNMGAAMAPEDVKLTPCVTHIRYAALLSTHKSLKKGGCSRKSHANSAIQTIEIERGT